jgi:hypothetical protein
MRAFTKGAFVASVAGALLFAFAGPAFSNYVTDMQITCSQVTANYSEFTAPEHPIVLHVSLNGVPQSVTTVPSPTSGESGTVTANISAITATLNGGSGVVSAFATWVPNQTSDTVSATLTCGTVPTTPTTPTTPDVEGTVVVRGQAVAAVPVQAQPTVTG